MATMSLQAAYDQARSYLEANRVDQAIGVAQHILEYFPENLEAHRILGEAYLAGRQFDQAEAAFSRVLHADPENIPAHVGLGITFERQGSLDRAVAEFEQALEVRPDMPELRSQLLRLYTDIWGSEGATLRLSRPGLARLYAKGHMLPQAIQEFRSVIEEHPERFDARVGLAEALWRDGQEQAALDACQEILAERGDVLKANLLLGYIRLANSDDSGEPPWRLAQQLDPYQTVARALFETLPDVSGPDLNIPAWDEAAWSERRAREEAERLGSQRPAAAAGAAVAGAAAAAAADEDFFSDTWLDAPAAPEAPVAPTLGAAPTAGPADEQDDFLAALLANTPPAPDQGGVDLDSTSGVTPFSLDDLSATPAPDADLAPFSLSDLGLTDDEIAALTDAGLGEATALPAGEALDLQPPALDDLGLSAEELDQLNFAAPAEPVLPASDEPELTPFSLADLGLSEDEIAQLNAVDAVEPALPASEEPELTPFSLADLGLSEDEIAEFGAASSPATPPPPPPPPSEADLPDFEPFDWDAIEAAEQAGVTPPAASAASALPELDADLGELTPFSLDDLDLSALGDESSASLPSALQPFSLDDATAQPPGSSLAPAEPEEAGEPGAYSWQQPSAKQQTDFVRQEEPEATGGSIFGRLKQAASERPPDEPPPLAPVSDEDVAASDYFSNDDVSLRLEETTSGERFAGGFRLPREGDATAEPPAGTGSGAAAAAAAGAAAAAAAAAASRQADEPPASAGAAEPELTPFSLEELGLSPEEIAALEAASVDEATLKPAAQAPQAAEPELTPFSLEELGLSPEEIAALEAASVDEATLKPAAQTPQAAEPELTPFSLEELGLSPEEIAALEAAERGDAPIPATGETIVPGWSQGEQPELTPFSLDDFGLDEVAGTAEFTEAGVEPFSLDEFSLEGPGPGAGVEFTEAGLEPFSLDDLGLGDFDAPPAGASRELGLSDEELAGLDLGDLETLISEGQGSITTPLAEDPEAAFDRLMMLGQNRGWVDLTDIIAVVSDPEAEADRIEEIGWALHRAGVEIRDGDEVIDMEEAEAEAEEYALEDDAGETPAAAPVAPPVDAEPELTPFSLEELGLTPEEIAALGLGETGAEAPAASSSAAASEEPELRPFSLEELGLSPEEIASLGLAEAGAEELAFAPPAASEEPELTPFSLEELGLSPEEIASLGLAEEPAVTPPAASEEPELTPFSLEELGLSPEEIAALGLAEAGADEPAVTPPAASEEPELTPFSLEELGLSPEEIAALGLAGTVAAGAAAAAAAPADDDSFDFDIAETTPVEKVTKRTEPRVEEPPPTVEPADAAFTPEPLDNLDDIWTAAAAAAAAATVTPTKPAPEAPAAPPPAPERPAARPAPERPAGRESDRSAPAEAAVDRGETATQVRGANGTARQSTRVSTRSGVIDRYARREALMAAPAGPVRAAAAVKSFADFVPSGDEVLDEYLLQLAAEPDNVALAMAIGRISAQTERPELMALAFKGVLREGVGVDELTEELEGLVGGVEGGLVRRQLYKLLGDAYSKQGRLRDAMTAYNNSFGR